jgi:hypothetical protein
MNAIMTMLGIRICAFTTAFLVALPTIAKATCGTRGGPGYRDPATGKCLSWDLAFRADNESRPGHRITIGR